MLQSAYKSQNCDKKIKKWDEIMKNKIYQAYYYRHYCSVVVKMKRKLLKRAKMKQMKTQPNKSLTRIQMITKQIMKLIQTIQMMMKMKQKKLHTNIELIQRRSQSNLLMEMKIMMKN